jgi:phosphatidylserine decarboxylase
MKIRQQMKKLLLQEDLNFLLTNRIPRITLTRFVGWWSHVRHPWLVSASIAVWRWFSDLDLSEAKQKQFATVHDCFTRELVPGARTVDADPHAFTSPCDAIVGAMGDIQSGQVFQAKGFPYHLKDLLGDSDQCSHWEALLQGGKYLTLRLTSSMYHRFHAPHDVSLEHVTYFSGDTWNVNPIALARVEKLFCKNERAALHMRLADGSPFLMVPVAAVLVASMRLHALDVLLNLRYKGPTEIACSASYVKGQEMGWFEHGSTILLFLPPGMDWVQGIETGQRVRMGQTLLTMSE